MSTFCGAERGGTAAAIMRRVWGRAAALLIAAILIVGAALSIAGCGGGDGDAADGAATTATVNGEAGGGETTAPDGGETTATADGGDGGDAADGGEREQLKSHNDSGGGAAQFENARTAGSVVEFGTEAGPEDFEAVAAALHGYLDAKAARDWELACEYMSDEAVKSIAQFDPAGDAASCPALLEQFSSGTAPKILRRLAVADVGSVRIQGNEAHALYRGTKDLGFFMPMVFEADQWRVRTLAPSILP